MTKQNCGIRNSYLSKYMYIYNKCFLPDCESLPIKSSSMCNL